MKKYTQAGYVIMKFLIKRNMSVNDLANDIKISYSHTINMLHGERDIPPNCVSKIINALGLDKNERAELKEAVFISRKKIVILNKNKKDNVLRLIYLLTTKGNVFSAEQIQQCMKILNRDN